MEIESAFGLPAHPLVVHAAVVLVPLAVVVTIVVAASRRLRRDLALVALGVALAATIAVGFAQGSGEALEERVDETPLIEDHAGKGERVLPWTLGLTVVSLGLVWAAARQRRRPDAPTNRVRAVATVAAVIAGVGATAMVIDVGHSGAKATWDDVDTAASGD